MADLIRKLMPVEVKEVGERTLEIAGSTEDKDRMGDIIRASGWKLGPFKKNPVFMWGHKYDEPPIGRANKVWVDKETNRLMFNVEFAGPEVYEFADTIYKLYKGGFLHATSVGFIPLNWDGKDEENPSPNREGNIFTSQELLELSAVPVPANANALVSARDEGLITVKEFEAVRHLAEENALATKLDGIASCECEKYSGNRFLGITCDECGTVVTKPEETEEYYRIPVKGEEGKHEGHRIRTIDIDKDKGIKALYCGECKKVITYLFDKEKWDGMKECQEWVEEHSKSNERPLEKVITQSQLADELDYTLTVIKAVGIREDEMPLALDLASEIIQRYQGSDIPLEIQAKVRMVINLRNRERLTQIQMLTHGILDNAETPTEEGEILPEPDPAVEARLRAQDVAEVATLVIAKLKGKRI